LAPLYFIFGHSILAVQLFQILLSALIAVLIYYLAKKYFSKTIALLAVLFFALYPPLIAYSSEVLTEIPFTFLLLLTVLLTIKAKEKQSLWLFALAGILCGLATLTRFIALFLPFALFFFFAVVIHSWKKSLKYALIMAVACFAVIAPWILRNYLIFHTFVFRATGGEILWSGSYIPWDGEWKGAISPVKELREGLTPVEIDKKFTRLAFQNIKENPVGVFWIWLKKPAKIFLKSEFNAVLERDNKFAKFLYRFSWLGPALVKMFFLLLNVVILALAALGIKRAWQQNYFITLLFLAVFAYFLLCYLPLNPDSRYKLPLTPYLFIFAASGCLTTGEWFRQQLKSKSQAQVLIKS
jgi:4-amino-4-deoxy-L-arabinose transferase-like glycosyltransferase